MDKKLAFSIIQTFVRLLSLRPSTISLILKTRDRLIGKLSRFVVSIFDLVLGDFIISFAFVIYKEV